MTGPLQTAVRLIAPKKVPTRTYTHILCYFSIYWRALSLSLIHSTDTNDS
eukprot:SAG11_NODE_28730_length_318_cov_1.182648_2_plen_49_part_01